MGRRGPKPQPTAFKVSRGNPGKRALNHDEPQLPPADLTPPADLEGPALEYWTSQGPALVASGVLTMADLKCFETTCRIVGDVARYTKLAGDVKPEEALRLGYAGQLLKIRGQLKQYLEILGLTPSSRSGIKARKPVDAADERRRKILGIHRSSPTEA